MEKNPRLIRIWVGGYIIVPGVYTQLVDLFGHSVEVPQLVNFHDQDLKVIDCCELGDLDEKCLWGRWWDLGLPHRGFV